MPKKSGAWERYYSNIWNPTDYGFAAAGQGAGQSS